ncbi:uncharacterized protein [Choristoneura fumiferana]|uniref:uncharacterized protein n=1 Tax=Choristoneura fumiferana TaxID=7141 RepID=UPI003D15390E
MAHTARLLSFLLISVIILANVETKKRSSSKPHTYPHSYGGSGGGRHATSAPQREHTRYIKTTTPRIYDRPTRVVRPDVWKPTSAPTRPTTGAHTYPLSFNGSGGGRQVTSAPTLGYTPYPQTKPTSGSHTYPLSPGGSGGGRQVTSAPILGYTPYPQTKPTSGSHTYPLSPGGSGGSRQVTSAPILGNTPYPQTKPTSGTHTYPLSPGGSGSGFKPNLDPRTGSYPRPSGTNTVISTINVNTGHTDHGVYNNHIYVRNQPTTYYISNTRTTHIYHYPYNPPHGIRYTDNGNRVVYYSAYTGRLPNYVFEYRASKSRYSKLLAGLALYNLGRVTRKSEIQTFHSSYQPRPDEMCLFSVYYDEYRFDEMEIDCRLMTDFIWTQNKLNQPATANENAIVLPNGTLVLSYTQIAPKSVKNALDPMFNGHYVHVTPNMKCYMIWTVSYTFPRREKVECRLLQTFVDKSMNSATTVTSTFVIILTTVAVLLV